MRQYIMSVVPRERSSAYAGLFSFSNIPNRLLLVVSAGYLTASYCPKDVRGAIESGTLVYGDSPEMMYFILGLVCLTGPLFLFLAKRVYYRK
jgi:hypothetical protein